jgi:acyl dehydratase
VLGLSVVMGLVWRLGVFEYCSIALLGVDKWRFQRPLLVGDTVHCRVDILATRLTSNAKARILSRTLTLINQHDEVIQQGGPA